MRDLRPDHDTLLLAHGATPDRTGHWKLGAEPHQRHSTAGLQAPDEARLRYRCGITAELDTERDVATITVATRCFGDPAWVKVGASTVSGVNRIGARSYRDVALQRGDTVERARTEQLPVSTPLSRP